MSKDQKPKVPKNNGTNHENYDGRSYTYRPGGKPNPKPPTPTQGTTVQKPSNNTK